MISTERPQEHTQVRSVDVGRYVLLPGDPGRCEKIAAHFDAPELVATNREYTTYTGNLAGEKVSVTSTGIGGPSASIAVEELIRVGADTFIRVGTSGGMQPEIRTGDVAIVSAAIRDEGTTTHYMPTEFPAVADVDVVAAMRDGARAAGIPYYVGISQSKDSFYGETEPHRMPVADRLLSRWKAWVAGGAICSEMEAAAIFVLSSIYRKRAGGVMLMAALPKEMPKTFEDRKAFEQKLAAESDLMDVERAIVTSIEGLKLLIERDRQSR